MKAKTPVTAENTTSESLPEAAGGPGTPAPRPPSRSRARIVSTQLGHVARTVMSAAQFSHPALTGAVIRSVRPGVNRSLAAVSPAPHGTTVLHVRERSGRNDQPVVAGWVRGEWVAGDWLDGDWTTPATPRAAAAAGDRIIYYLHGSGYVVCSPQTHRGMVARLAKRTGMAAFSIDYRLAPEHKFPKAGDDTIRGYHWLLAQGFTGDQIVVAGDSAGGHLALDLIADNHRTGTEQPAGLLALSPLYDPTFELATAYERSGVRDPYISAAAAQRILRLYTGSGRDSDPRMQVTIDPEIDLPPALIQFGGREVMGRDAHEYHSALVAAGGTATLEEWRGQGHVFQLFPGLTTDSGRALDRAAEFIKDLPRK